MWDELAVLAWIDPEMVSTAQTLYVDVNLDHGYNYGDTETWSASERPEAVHADSVQVQMGLDTVRFELRYLSL